ncbi:DUF6515 family protein [Microbulbifer halophilus]|uniref:DUF6515 family protein n=1 Tax=Microbulbifer halophilus TaxID=453963 RepID=A0ABW5EAZ8_9GAMM|nr:DUF6515 family protein [Microbulbifer halophilus]MCW8126070.1 DUF6515 family protein [Microbulbifer halophilus]
MKILKPLIGGIALLAVASFAFTPPADAGTLGYERGGHSWHHGHHHKRWHRHHRRYRRGPRISIGLTAPMLPFGVVNLAVGGRPYYYHSGHFYRPAPTGYRVVTAPLGASVTSLPGSAVRVETGSGIYYRYASAYYRWRPASRSYAVVPPPAGTPVAATKAAPTRASGYNPGQVVEDLPTGYTAEIINGVQYYRYGDDYFMPTQRDGREVYVVVRI